MEWIIYILAGISILLSFGSLDSPFKIVKVAAWVSTLCSIAAIIETSFYPLLIGVVISWGLKIVYGESTK